MFFLSLAAVVTLSMAIDGYVNTLFFIYNFLKATKFAMKKKLKTISLKRRNLPFQY